MEQDGCDGGSWCSTCWWVQIKCDDPVVKALRHGDIGYAYLFRRFLSVLFLPVGVEGIDLAWEGREAVCSRRSRVGCRRI